jgi:ribulose-phosphate 3-epimerase|tara:strand:+ start:115 stop:816 length:702 start_codon:yes stop_codon:yes gene_type:complete
MKNKNSDHVKISASLMCVNWLKAEEEIQILNEENIDLLHIDVIDGRYAPDFTMGTSIINCFRDIFKRPFDYHLMVEEPSRIFETFDIRDGDSFAIHQECCRNLHRDLITLRQMGAKVGVALSPATPISTLDYIIEDLDHVLLMTVNPGFKGQALVPQAVSKIKDLKEYIDNRGLDVAIHVDGNVSIENIPTMVSNGGDTLISGSSGMFMKEMRLKESIKIFREAISRGINARS